MTKGNSGKAAHIEGGRNYGGRQRKKVKFLLQLLAGLLSAILFLYKDEVARLVSSAVWERFDKVILSSLEIIAWFSLGWAISGGIDVILWRPYERRKHRQVPRLLREIVDAMVLIGVVLSSLAHVFNAPVAGVIAGSSVMAAVIGLAVTKMISDVFSGGALSIERAYAIGDWLEIEIRSRKSGFITGKVVEVNWRSTHLHTEADEIVVIPNSEMARMKFINFSIPKRFYRAEVQVPLSHTIPSERVARILLAAVRSTPDVMKEPPSKITLLRFDPRGVLWAARFWISDYSYNRQVVKAVHENILRHLQIAGIDISYNIVEQRQISFDDLELNRMPVKEKLIRRVQFFEFFEPRQIERLADAMVERIFAAKDTIVRQGEEGASLFIVAEGLVHIQAQTEKGEERHIANIEPGQYFGEMSLLTHQPRTASAKAVTEVVCYEITKEVLSPILHETPALVEKISEIVARRGKQLVKMLQDQHKDAGKVKETSNAQWVLKQIKNFFGIG